MKNRIREHRKARGWTLDDLASRVGTSGGHLSDIETDKREPSTTMLRNIAAALDVDLPDLVAAGDGDEGLASLLRYYHGLGEEDRAAVVRHAASLFGRGT